ncbi:MAG: dicarboxylate/amino acid:cation symporter [Bacteroidales bacterium]|nr:dicarboxylate/amino acid:cation symporter [Bacteroidales bacterium]
MKRIRLALHCCTWGNVVSGIGNIFLNAINMIVIPLVFLSTVLGFASMDGTKSMGRVAAKSFGYFFVLDIIAAIVAVVITMSLRPGYGAHYLNIEGASAEVLTNAEAAEHLTLMDKIVGIVPSNIFAAFSSGAILPIIFFSILLGIFITKISDEKQLMLTQLFESFNDVVTMITTFFIRFAPLGVFAIVMSIVGRQAGNLEELKSSFLSIAFFVFVVWISLLTIGGIILPVVVGLTAHVSPLKHLRQIYSALLLAFSTSSSYSALPLIISDAKEKFGVSNSIASFTVPLGITFNKIGTIIYECVAVIFVAQAVGADLSIAQQLSLIAASIVTVLGAPSVPMAGVVVLAILLNTMGLPTSYIGMFVVVDMLCDMPKTLINAYSVSCSAIIVARSEGEKLTI